MAANDVAPALRLLKDLVAKLDHADQQKQLRVNLDIECLARVDVADDAEELLVSLIADARNS